MIIIGCDYHPGFQQCRAFLARRRGQGKSAGAEKEIVEPRR